MLTNQLGHLRVCSSLPLHCGKEGPRGLMMNTQTLPIQREGEGGMLLQQQPLCDPETNKPKQ